MQHGCTCSILLWCHDRFFISTHSEVEAKVCAELEAHGLLASPDTPTPRALAFEDLSGLTYLGAAIKVWRACCVLQHHCSGLGLHAPCFSSSCLAQSRGVAAGALVCSKLGVLHVQEAMRMKPAVASGTMRVCQKDCTLGNGRCGIVTYALCLIDQHIAPELDSTDTLQLQATARRCCG